MRPERPDEFLHRLELASHGARAPFFEEPVGPPRTFVLPECVEGFLEEIGPDSLEVVLQHFLELGVLIGGEVDRPLEEAKPGFGQHGFVSTSLELLGFLPPDRIDSLAKLFDDVEAVEHVERCGQHAGDDVEIGLPHVRTHHLDSGAALGAEFLKEAGETLGLAIFDDSQQALGSVVDLIDEGHVVVAESVGDFIDAEGGDAVQIPVFEAIIDDPFDGTADVVPGSVEAGGGFFPAEDLCPGGEEAAECVAASVLALRPGDALDFDAAAGAVDATHGVGEGDWDVVDGDELKQPRCGHVIVARTRFPTTGALGPAVGSGAHLGDDAQRLAHSQQFDGMVNETLDRLNNVE